MSIARAASTEPALFEIHAGPFAVGAPLQCEASDAVVFVQEGRIIGSLGPGSHALDPGTAPFLAPAVRAGNAGLPMLAADAMFVRMQGARFHREGPVGSLADELTKLTLPIVARVTFGLNVTDIFRAAFGLAGMGDAGAVATWFGDTLISTLREQVRGLSAPVQLGALFAEQFALDAPALLMSQNAATFDTYGLALVEAPTVTFEIAQEAQARWEQIANPLMNERANQLIAASQGAVCASCGTPANGKFCPGCGAALPRACSCGAALPAGAKFCAECGARA